MGYPIEFRRYNRKYTLAKVYDEYGLYVYAGGIRECFNPPDLGMIPERRKPSDVSNGVMSKYLK